MRRLSLSMTGAFALVAFTLTSTGIAMALHDEAHTVGMAAWEVDGVPVAVLWPPRVSFGHGA